ncbi:hypothetical protein IAQ61_000713 [Plenodomus lingam]|uniref:GPI anchored protein n=1 Tax=Leptosphaeria maculans (strain JN3 / isolate v23.1.3 / race Av1-4-5-6-7-8) TaxID=985895 RepID=E5A6B9_LEPMJ|nr:predicted protein [Plenodomus lingam JN3]KAH9880422.1 hypothetical protein IAQ61_000713 [Plenodomus lingam]CBX99164.1 predicted protein [Plenodomus lingam JN3]
MAKFSTSMLALFAFSFANVAVTSTTFSSDVVPAPSSSLVEPPAPIVTSVVLSTTTVADGPSSESTSTTCTTVTVTTAITATVVNGESTTATYLGSGTIEDGFTIQTSIPSKLPTGVLPVPDNSTVIVPSGTALPTHGASTVMTTHTAGPNHTSGASTGGPKPTASATFPPEFNAASGVNFGFAALAVAVAAAVFGI